MADGTTAVDLAIKKVQWKQGHKMIHRKKCVFHAYHAWDFEGEFTGEGGYRFFCSICRDTSSFVKKIEELKEKGKTRTATLLKTQQDYIAPTIGACRRGHITSQRAESLNAAIKVDQNSTIAQMMENLMAFEDKSFAALCSRAEKATDPHQLSEYARKKLIKLKRVVDIYTPVFHLAHSVESPESDEAHKKRMDALFQLTSRDLESDSALPNLIDCIKCKLSSTCYSLEPLFDEIWRAKTIQDIAQRFAQITEWEPNTIEFIKESKIGEVSL